MNFLKKNAFVILYVLFFSGIIFLTRHGVILENEWPLILKEFDKGSEYRFYGVASAYMPPFFPYFLLVCKVLFGFTTRWESISCLLQASFFFWCIVHFCKSIVAQKGHKALIYVIVVVFFPPIFFALCKISSFGFTVGVVALFVAQIYRIFVKAHKTISEWIVLLFAVILGLYLRYELIMFYAFILFTLVFLKRIHILRCLSLILLIWLLYLPWTIRNYYKIGVFSYSTSLNYNFAKGNNVKYNIYSYNNFAYSPQTDEFFVNDMLYKKLGNEKEIDQYLGELNKTFLKEHPELFIKLSFQKLGINFFQFFPDYSFLSNIYIAFSYSLMAVILQIAFLLAIYRNIRSRYLYDFSVLALSIYIFFLIFYSIAPLPRYFLFFFPVFIIIIFSRIGSKDDRTLS